MKLVTHQLAIGGKSGQVHFVDEKNDDAVYGFVVWKFCLTFLFPVASQISTNTAPMGVIPFLIHVATVYGLVKPVVFKQPQRTYIPRTSIMQH